MKNYIITKLPESLSECQVAKGTLLSKEKIKIFINVYTFYLHLITTVLLAFY